MLPIERLNGDWPSTYDKLIIAPTIVATGKLRICKTLPALFVHVDSDISKTEIVEMEWNHKITGSKKEQKEIGRESRITTQVCEASILDSSDLVKAVDMHNMFHDNVFDDQRLRIDTRARERESCKTRVRDICGHHSELRANWFAFE